MQLHLFKCLLYVFLHIYVFEEETHICMQRVSNEQLKKNSVSGKEKDKHTKRDWCIQEEKKRQRDKVKYQILCLSLMTQDPHGREGKPRSQRDMKNSETDNLKPQHSQSTDTHIHTES